MFLQQKQVLPPFLARGIVENISNSKYLSGMYSVKMSRLIDRHNPALVDKIKHSLKYSCNRQGSGAWIPPYDRVNTQVLFQFRNLWSGWQVGCI